MDLEDNLDRNGTHVARIFLHLSKNAQRKRFLERLDESYKHWKFSLVGIRKRKFWQHCTKAYGCGALSVAILSAAHLERFSLRAEYGLADALCQRIVTSSAAISESPRPRK